MWFPEVRTSMPSARSSPAIFGVTPKPPAEFSQLAITASGPHEATSSGRRRSTAFLPGSPTISLINSIFIYFAYST